MPPGPETLVVSAVQSLLEMAKQESPVPLSQMVVRVELQQPSHPLGVSVELRAMLLCLPELRLAPSL
jgi:hypothetical protein